MWATDIMLALELMYNDRGHSDFTIEKIDHNFIYLSNGERIAFRDVEGFMEETGRRDGE